MISRRMAENKKRPAPRTPAGSPATSRSAKKPAAPDEKASSTDKPAAKPRAPKTPASTSKVVRAMPNGRGSGPGLSIFMVASEAHPYAKTGGLAEVAAALPDALGRLGHRVTLALPRYRGVDVSGSRSQIAVVPVGHHAQHVAFHTREERPGVTVVFVDVPELFDRAGLYNVDGVDYADNG